MSHSVLSLLNMKTITENDLGRIRWRCVRRGMLELDIILGNFFDQHFSSLDDREQELFVSLLEKPDPLLYAWLLGQEIPKKAEDLEIIKKIRELNSR